MRKVIEAPFQVGDRVTTDYGNRKKDVVRQITRIEPDANTGSGFRAWADGGKVCQCCGYAPDHETLRTGIDSAWFTKVDKE